jgi:hypothetical protein
VHKNGGAMIRVTSRARRFGRALFHWSEHACMQVANLLAASSLAMDRSRRTWRSPSQCRSTETNHAKTSTAVMGDGDHGAQPHPFLRATRRRSREWGIHLGQRQPTLFFGLSCQQLQPDSFDRHIISVEVLSNMCIDYC